MTTTAPVLDPRPAQLPATGGRRSGTRTERPQVLLSDDIARIADQGRAGIWGPLARAITTIENAPPWEVSVPRQGVRSHVVGITGPPGAGKSTLTGRLIESFSDAGARVAVVAIDPSSPITGGAVLGDRLRMETHLTGRPEVFVRSLASRGSHGAVAASTRNVARLLEVTGLFDVILIETVGAGQTEVAIVDVADTAVLVTVPGLGDAVQTIKAGLMEVADMFVVNMADRPGAAETARHFRQAARREQAVLQTVATAAEGVDAVRLALEQRWARLTDTGEIESLRAGKLATDAVLLAESWLQECSKDTPPTDGETVRETVGRLLQEATRRWTT